MLYVIERGEKLLNIKIDLLKNYYIMQISHKCSLVRNVKNLREIVKPDLHMSTKKSCRIDKFICSLGENETKKGCLLTHFWFCISSHALLSTKCFIWHLYCFQHANILHAMHFRHKIINERCNDVRMSIFSIHVFYFCALYIFAHRRMMSCRQLL